MHQAAHKKAPGARNTEGFQNTTNALNSDTSNVRCKAVATQIAQLALAGHAVHELLDGGYLICKYGYTYFARDFAAMQEFACRLGVSK